MPLKKTPRLISVLLFLTALFLNLSCQKELSCLDCQPVNPTLVTVNRPPVANAGRDQFITTSNPYIQLDGRFSSDPDNNIATYKWSRIKGPSSIQILNPEKILTNTSKPDAGLHIFELVVTDAKGLSSRDTVVVTVNATQECYNSSCQGYWVCPSNERFSSVFLTSPQNQYWPGAFGAATANAEKIFFGGGHEEGSYGGVIEAVNVFNTLSRNWSSTSLSIPRSYLSAASCANKVLFAGGADIVTADPSTNPINVEYYKRVDIFDANNLSRSTTELSEARAYMASASTADMAFFIGGKTISGFSSKMDIYNAANNTWKVVDLPHARANAAAVISGSKLFIAGGSNSSGTLKTADIYDLNTGTWSVLEIPHEHPFAVMALVMNKIVIAGGDGLNNKAVDIFDLNTSTWTAAELSNSRFHMAVAVANNTVLFLGGNYSCNIDIYKAETNQWQLTQLNEPVTGVAAASAGNTCAFAGMLYQSGNVMTSTVIVINP